MYRIMLFALLGLLAFASPSFSAQPSQKQAASQSLQPIKHSDVCMVQNRHGMMKMIPVEIDGKTYYGCCAGCVAKLKFSPKVRFSADPLTGKEVDKSKAFIIGNSDGTVSYFESRETAERYFATEKTL